MLRLALVILKGQDILLELGKQKYLIRFKSGI